MKKDRLKVIFKYGGLCIAVLGAILWYANLIPKYVQLISFTVGIICFIFGSYGLNKKE